MVKSWCGECVYIGGGVLCSAKKAGEETKDKEMGTAPEEAAPQVYIYGVVVRM
jgi:hypothetical protein